MSKETQTISDSSAWPSNKEQERKTSRALLNHKFLSGQFKSKCTVLPTSNVPSLPSLLDEASPQANMAWNQGKEGTSTHTQIRVGGGGVAKWNRQETELQCYLILYSTTSNFLHPGHWKLHCWGDTIFVVPVPILLGIYIVFLPPRHLLISQFYLTQNFRSTSTSASFIYGYSLHK
jgi:hypothetical protein